MKKLKRLTVLRACACGFLLAFLVIHTPDVRSQAVTATLSGKIADSSGGSVAKASITVTGTATGFSRTAQSSDTGEYRIPSLPAGEYKVTVEFAGFKSQTKDITLQVGQSADLDFVLTPGQVTEKVEVETAAMNLSVTRNACRPVFRNVAEAIGLDY